jgi:acetylornithine deacetylase/succinyl-diaminopimelate desuccinylase-like protein
MASKTPNSAVSSFIDSNQARFKEELYELLRIPSVSTDSSQKDSITSAAKFLADKLKNAGMQEVKLVDTPGNPVVMGKHLAAGEDKPTVLIYGHYDVQPPEPLDLWTSPPFEPVEKDGKVYARGASDDKGQAFIHVKAIESWLQSGESLPVNVKIILEGEEEIGSPNLVPFLKEYQDELSCDMVLVSDTAMFAKNTPSITYGLRGLAYMEMEVFGPDRDLHSGAYGGALTNPLNALCNMIAKLQDEDGKIQIPGFYDDVIDLSPDERDAYSKLPFDEEGWKDSIGIDAVTGEAGYSTLERKSARPTLDMNGMWGGYQGEGAKTVLPAKAGAKISMRLVPNQHPDDIAEKFTRHIQTLAPEGVKVKVTPHHGGHPAMTPLDFYGLKAAGQAYGDVYGKEPLFAREGGSIPIVADFEKVLGVNTILMGFGLNTDAIHSPNEHFSLDDFHKGIKTSARFLEVLPDYSADA